MDDLDKIIRAIREDAYEDGRLGAGHPYSIDENRQAILDWHNKRVEEVLDRLLVDVSSPNASIDQVEMIELINLYISKLKEKS